MTVFFHVADLTIAAFVKCMDSSPVEDMLQETIYLCALRHLFAMFFLLAPLFSHRVVLAA